MMKILNNSLGDDLPLTLEYSDAEQISEKMHIMYEMDKTHCDEIFHKESGRPQAR